VRGEHQWVEAETGGEVDATHVLDNVIPYGINFDHTSLLSLTGILAIALCPTC